MSQTVHGWSRGGVEEPGSLEQVHLEPVQLKVRAPHPRAGLDMTFGKDALLRMHAGAVNAHDHDSVLLHHHAGVRCIRDGCLVGEGHDAVRRALLEEFPVSEELVGRVMDLDGEPVLVGWGGAEGREHPRGILRIEAHGDRVMEVRIDHDARSVQRLGIRPYT